MTKSLTSALNCWTISIVFKLINYLLNPEKIYVKLNIELNPILNQILLK
jgi:hypothetical protein